MYETNSGLTPIPIVIRMQTSSRLQIDFFSFIHELLSSWSRIAQGQSERWIRPIISALSRRQNEPVLVGEVTSTGH